MVGTHVPDDRDQFLSGLQRMREAFDAVRDGELDAGTAEDIFRCGYDTVADIAAQWFIGRPH